MLNYNSVLSAQTRCSKIGLSLTLKYISLLELLFYNAQQNALGQISTSGVLVNKKRQRLTTWQKLLRCGKRWRD